MSLEDVAGYLPPMVQDMVRLVGFADAEKIIRTFGGTCFYFTNGAIYQQKLVELVGRESAVKLCQYFQGEVYIPRCDVALRILRNRQFKADFDYLLNEKKQSGRQAMLALCPKYQISDRYGWRLLRECGANVQLQAGLF